MSTPVYFIDLRTTLHKNLSQKISLLLDAAGFNEVIASGSLTAVKVHFGEKGNTAFIRPHLLRDIVQRIQDCGGKPFLTDANTLYRGERTEAVSHLLNASQHGFTEIVTGAPVIIADGLKGTDAVSVPVEGKHCTSASIASAIHHADAVVSVAHFKGHELSGFGGTLKNIGMGCASREGKMQQHTGIAPRIDRRVCIGCGLCAARCPVGAIALANDKASITAARCIGCAFCILTCPREAVKIVWDDNATMFMEKMVEYARAVAAPKQGRLFFINFLTDISPACDCYGHADYPIVPDIGVVAAKDPVAIDQASADLVNAAQGFTQSMLQKNHKPGADKFKGIYPQVPWEHQLAYAEKLGLGSRAYRLVRIA